MGNHYLYHQMDSLDQLKQSVADNRNDSLGFGAIVLLGSSIPIVNFFVMPIAVVAATVFWVETIKKEDQDS